MENSRVNHRAINSDHCSHVASTGVCCDLKKPISLTSSAVSDRKIAVEQVHTSYFNVQFDIRFVRLYGIIIRTRHIVR
jgi:hypothetical protein